MRTILVAAVLGLLFAGCVAPEEDDSPSLFGVCPQWIVGPWEAQQKVSVGGDATVFSPEMDGEPLYTFQGHPLDRYTVRFSNITIEGDLEVRGFADEASRRLAFMHGGQSSPFIAPAEGDEVDLFLTAVAQGTAAASDALRLQWSGATGTMDVSVLAWYRVCGVPS